MPEHLHFVPGRLRLKLAQLKDPSTAANAEQQLRRLPGVTSVTASPLTGSLVIHYDGDELPLTALWKVLSRRGYASGPCPSRTGIGYQPTGASATDRLACAVLAAFAESLARQTATALIRALL